MQHSNDIVRCYRCQLKVKYVFMLSFVLSLAAVSGCASIQYTPNPIGGNASNVRVLYEYPSAPYEVLGIVDCVYYKPGLQEPTVTDALPKLKRKVQEVGGNALIVRSQRIGLYFIEFNNRFITISAEALLVKHQEPYPIKHKSLSNSNKSTFEDKSFIGTVGEYKTEGSIASETFPHHYKKGVEYYKQSNYGQAATEFEEAIKINPNDNFALHNLGATYYHMAKYDDAVRILQKCIKIKPDYANAHLTLSLVYRKHGRIQEADEEKKLYKSLKP